MPASFLTTFMEFARDITGAERSLAMDADLNIVGRIDISPELLKQQSFIMMARQIIKQSLRLKSGVLTNNLFQDPSDAPTTNTNFSNLRVVVAIPIIDHGGIYLDQHIRQGVIAREDIDRLTAFAGYLVESNRTDITAEELSQLYDALN